MEPYLQDWLDILDEMKNTNTYKLAFGLGILECLSSGRYEENLFDAKVALLDIGDCMIRYYWNQCFYFHLKQQPGNKVPTIYQEVEALVSRYKELSSSEIPVWCDKGLAFIESLDPAFLEKARRKVARTIPENVGWRFKNTAHGTKEVYRFDPKKDDGLYFAKKDVLLLQEFYPVLSKLFGYKWSQLLETWNESPRLLGKVLGASNEKIERHSLKKFVEPLSLEFDRGPIRDFYTHEALSPKEISVDHVIPWSYLYSDDIWNLVLTSKSTNSRKGNSTPTQKEINRLKERNETLLPKLGEGPWKEAMKESVARELVDRYYFGLRRAY